MNKNNNMIDFMHNLNDQRYHPIFDRVIIPSFKTNFYQNIIVIIKITLNIKILTLLCHV